MRPRSRGPCAFAMCIVRLGRVEAGAMATYKQIQQWVREQYGWTPKTCWIAHCKELAGLPVKRAPNRQEDSRAVPCPADKQPAIFAAFRHFPT